MRRRTILESVDKESELCHSTLRGEAQNLEHLFLQLAIVDTERATTHFNTITNKVVSHGTNFFWGSIQQRNIIRIWHREWMVSSHEALLFITPLKEWEVNNPQANESIFITQSKTIAHLQTKGAKLYTGLIGIITTENQYKVAILSAHSLFHLSPYLWGIELIDRRLNSTILIELDINQSLSTDLRTLDEISKLIELLTRIISTTRHTNTTNIVGLIEDWEGTSSLQLIHQLYKLHTETEIGLIRTKTTHGLMPSHTLKWREFYTTYLFKQMTSHILEELKYIFLLYKRHLTVNLCKLRLTVGTKVFITETLGNLEITVEP